MFSTIPQGLCAGVIIFKIQRVLPGLLSMFSHFSTEGLFWGVDCLRFLIFWLSSAFQAFEEITSYVVSGRKCT